MYFKLNVGQGILVSVHLVNMEREIRKGNGKIFEKAKRH